MKTTLRRIGLALAVALVSTWALATTVTLISGKATTGVGSPFAGNQSPGSKTYQALCRTTSGTGTAVISIEGSNDGINFDSTTPLATATIPLTTASAPWPNAVFTSTDRAARVHANVSTLTGTGANCTVYMSY